MEGRLAGRNAVVNLQSYPVPDPNPIKPGSEFTIGDMHGNALKFVHFLVKQKVLNITKEQYADITAIYNKPTDALTAEDLKRFNSIIANAPVNRDASVRLIGDELADRGKNDYFTLKIFEKLNREKVGVKVLFSNHGGEFLRAYEGGFKSFSSALGAGQSRSLDGLGNLVSRGLVNINEVNDIVKKHYQPNFKLIDYAINSQGEITLYTHAPVGINTMIAMAKELNIPFEADTPHHLAKTIDAINEKSQRLGNVFERAKLDSYPGDSGAAGLDHPLIRLMWTRRSDAENRKFNDNIDPMVDNFKGYKVNYVHGHDGHGISLKPHIANLDNSLGISDRHGVGAMVVEVGNNIIKPQPIMKPGADLTAVANPVTPSDKIQKMKEKLKLMFDLKRNEIAILFKELSLAYNKDRLTDEVVSNLNSIVVSEKGGHDWALSNEKVLKKYRLINAMEDMDLISPQQRDMAHLQLKEEALKAQLKPAAAVANPQPHKPPLTPPTLPAANLRPGRLHHFMAGLSPALKAALDKTLPKDFSLKSALDRCVFLSHPANQALRHQLLKDLSQNKQELSMFITMVAGCDKKLIADFQNNSLGKHAFGAPELPVAPEKYTDAPHEKMRQQVFQSEVNQMVNMGFPPDNANKLEQLLPTNFFRLNAEQRCVTLNSQRDQIAEALSKVGPVMAKDFLCKAVDNRPDLIEKLNEHRLGQNFIMNPLQKSLLAYNQQNLTALYKILPKEFFAKTPQERTEFLCHPNNSEMRHKLVSHFQTDRATGKDFLTKVAGNSDALLNRIKETSVGRAHFAAIPLGPGAKSPAQEKPAEELPSRRMGRA